MQYGLAERAVVLGWAPSRVLVIDDDLGHSASGADARPGFQRLVSEVGLDHVGIVLGIEMSRLARSGREWHQLLELCALSGTLLGDPDGIYDPADHNDRLLLGLKGTISEALCRYRHRASYADPPVMPTTRRRMGGGERPRLRMCGIITVRRGRPARRRVAGSGRAECPAVRSGRSPVP